MKKVKELSIEEKAKRYDEAIKRARDFKNDIIHHEVPKGSHIMDYIFPELKESEDGKLSKKLHECVCMAINNDMLPYEERKYISEQVLPYLENLEKQKEQKPTWSEKDEEMLRRCISATFVHEYLKECDWLKSLKDKVRSSIDEKSIPSEEFVLNVWMLGNEWKDITKGVCDTEHGTQLDYVLKHWKEGEYYEKIKPQSYWKPTKDQMEIIEMVLTDEAMDDNVHSILKSLYSDLQKLM